MENTVQQNLMSWLNGRLKFVNRNIEDAQATKNYGKELQFSSMKEVYVELLLKIKQEFPG